MRESPSEQLQSTEVRADLATLPARYAVRRVLGHGSAKRVYLGFDSVLDREVAIAVQAVIDEDHRADMRREAQTMALLSDRARIVAIYDLIESPERLIIVQQYVPGGDLGGRLRNTEQQRLPLAEVSRIGREIFTALSAAHQDGIAHCDLKPGNVLLDEQGQVYLCDFGIARVVDWLRIGDDEPFFGTPTYMAPEQVRNQAVGTHSDHYAFGCLLFEMLSGRPAFEGSSAEIIRRKLNEDFDASDLVGLGTPAALVHLIEALLARDPAQRPGSGDAVNHVLETAAAAGSTARVAIPFVGRAQELTALEALRDRVLAGEPCIALLTGAPGIGKSRLLARAFDGFARHGGYQLMSQCIADDPQPFGGLLRALADSREPPFVALRAALGGTEHDESLAALVATIGEIARERPLLLIVDDLQWADQATIRLVNAVLGAINAGPLSDDRIGLVLGSRAGGEADRLLASMRISGRDRPPITLALRGLGLVEMRDWIIARCGVEPTRRLVHRIAAACSGNPLLLAELFDQLERSRRLKRVDGRLVPVGDADDLSLPRSLTAAIGRKTRAISDACRRVLTIASFLGNEFDVTLLASVLGSSQPDLAAALNEAKALNLIESQQDSAVRFNHPVTRHLFYDAPSERRREATHVEIAERLIAYHGPAADAHCLDIAHHLVRGGSRAQPSAVMRFAPLAGQRALKLYAYDQAGRYFEAAARVDSDRLDAPTRAALHLEAGEAFRRSSDVGPSNINLDEAARLFEELDNVTGLANALQGRLRNQIAFGTVSPGRLADIAQLEALVSRVGATDHGLRVKIYDTLASAYHGAGHNDTAQAYGETALSIARNAPDPELACIPITSIALAQMDQLEVGKARDTWLEGLAHDRAVGTKLYEGFHLQRLPIPLFCLGELDEAAKFTRQSQAHNRSIRNTGELSLNLAVDVMIANLRGDFTQALRLGEAAMELIALTGYAWVAPSLVSAMAFSLAMLERWRDADQVVEQLTEDGRILEDASPYRSVGLRCRALLAAYEGRLDVARELTPAQPSPWSASRLRIASLGRFCAEIELALLLDRPDLASNGYDALRFASDRQIQLPLGWSFLIPRSVANAAALRGPWDVAEQQFTLAARQAERMGAPLEMARTRLDRSIGALRRRCADPQSIHDELNAARATFEQYEAGPLLRRADHWIEYARSVESEPQRDH